METIVKNVIGITSTEDGLMTWLPTATEIKPSVNALDSSKSGRDNNTGAMFRDMIGLKLKYTIQLPANMSNKEVKEILEILLQGSVWVHVPNILTGKTERMHFYCSTVAPEISKYSRTQTSTWYYKSWSFNITEM